MDILNNLPWFWFGLMVLFIIIEICTFGLTTVWFAIGALFTIFLSFTPLAFSLQLLIFLLISSLLLILTRPLALKKLKKKTEKTNVDSLIGKKALVVKDITEFDKGEVKVDGKIWTARSDDESTITQGKECVVLRIEGVTMIVIPDKD